MSDNRINTAVTLRKYGMSTELLQLYKLKISLAGTLPDLSEETIDYGLIHIADFIKNSALMKLFFKKKKERRFRYMNDRIKTKLTLRKYGTGAEGQELYELEISLIGTLADLSEEVIDYGLNRVSAQVMETYPKLSDH